MTREVVGAPGVAQPLRVGLLAQDVLASSAGDAAQHSDVLTRDADRDRHADGGAALDLLHVDPSPGDARGERVL